MIKIANFIDEVINNKSNDKKINKVRNSVSDLCKNFPLYAD